MIACGFAGAVLRVAVLVAGSAGANLAIEIVGLAILGVSLGSVMSVSSIAILGAVPMHRSGMAAGVEEVSCEFDTLIAVVLTGSLLPMWLARLLPPELQSRGMDVMYDLALNPLAEPVYVGAFDRVLVVLAVLEFAYTLATWWCFCDTPKSGDSHGTVPV